MQESRTKKSIKNSIVALAVYVINLVLQFFVRRVFLEYLGTEILGLNTTVMNMLQFLNLAEMGIGAAIGFTLFKPMADNDRIAINEILTLHSWLYRRVAWFIILGSIVLLFFFPMIFAKTDLPLWYAYASFGVVLLSQLLSYFMNSKQVILTASQNDYKLLYSYRSVMLIKLALQALAVRFYEYPYVAWLVLEALFSILASVSLNITIHKTFPYLKNSDEPIRHLRKKHSVLITKIKQVFFHKIGGFALTQSSPLIIYAYANLTLVTLYGNYLLIVNSLISLLGSMFNSMAGGIGNLVATASRKKIVSVFSELFAIRFLLVTTLCVGFFIMSPVIIELWIGQKYELPAVTVLLITATMFINANRHTVDNFLGAYGLFGDIFSPIVEATLNIGLSILLGYYYGLNGILSGVLISLFVVIFCWKPYYLFTRGIRDGFSSYLKILGKNVMSGIVAGIIIAFTYSFVPFDSMGIWTRFSSLTGLTFGYTAICAAMQILLKTGITAFGQRLNGLLHK